MRFVEIPTGWSIAGSERKTSSAKQILQLLILIAQHHHVDNLLITSEQLPEDPQPLLCRNLGIDIEHVKRLDLTAKSSISLIHRFQDFPIRPTAAKCERGNCVVSAGKIAPANVSQIAHC